MPQATAFGRRGVAAPAPAAVYRPSAAPARPVARAEPRANASSVKAPPASKDDSIVAYLIWLLFRFEGRLNRRLYRYCRVAANLAFLIIVAMLRSNLAAYAANPGMAATAALLFLGLLALMAWTTLAMQVKRRHDLDRSWPWLFVGFVPILGPLWVLIETCWLDGTPGPNRFDDPAKSAAAVF